MYFTSVIDEDVKNNLEKISEELDYLGLPKINNNIDILGQLTSSILEVITLYRRTLTENKDLREQSTIFQKEITSKNKNISNIMKDLDEANQLKDLSSLESSKLKFQLENQKKDLKTQEILVEKYKTSKKSKEKEWKVKYDKLLTEFTTLKSSFSGNCNHNISSNFATELSKYKTKEQIYKETILKLQQNNENLLEQILNLEDEVKQLAITS